MSENTGRASMVHLLSGRALLMWGSPPTPSGASHLKMPPSLLELSPSGAWGEHRRLGKMKEVDRRFSLGALGWLGRLSI